MKNAELKFTNVQLNATYIQKVDTFKDVAKLSTRTDAVKKLIELGLQWHAMQQQCIAKFYPESSIGGQNESRS